MRMHFNLYTEKVNREVKVWSYTVTNPETAPIINSTKYHIIYVKYIFM